MKSTPIHYKSVWEHCEPKHHDASREEDFKECLRKILTEEIYNSRYWCLSFAQMGSKKCQRIADEKGWHKGPWKVEKPQASAKTKAEKQREKNRAYRAAHREELNAKCRAYRAKLKAAEPEVFRAKYIKDAEERKRLKKERQKAYQKEWAAAHRDKVQAACQRYYEKHREEFKARVLQRYYARKEGDEEQARIERERRNEYSRRWREANTEKMRECRHKSYEKHKDEILARRRQKYAEKRRKEAEQNELARLVYAGTGTADTGVIQLGIPDCCGDCQQVTG